MTDRRGGLRACCLLFLAGFAAPLPAQPREERREIQGLRAEADIRIDRWGIAHITAASSDDAFFLQGYNAARDRLWQIDLWRKRGLGRLAESFGPAYVDQDRAARLFLYRGSIDREWAAYPRGARTVATAFVTGVNAFVREVTTGARPLPVEFRLTGTRPALWQADDIVRIRSHALSRNLPSEVSRAQVACRAGLDLDWLRQDLSPSHQPQVPAGLNPCDVTDAVLVPYRLATASVRFDPAAPGLARAEWPDTTDSGGSNAWALAPDRTTTGRPILASDPHREHALPSLRYIVHVETPDWSMIGAGEPALPGISIGHNGAVAFGLTIFSADQEDLYVYELHPRDPQLYRYRGGWARMRQVRETIAVHGAPPRQVELLYTRHGPVLHLDSVARRAFAVRTVWSDPGTSAYFASTGIADAGDARSFRRAIARWGAPSVNQIYADTTGEIGGLVAGRIPVRPNWDGLMPVPGDGRYEWQGFVSPEHMPRPFAGDGDWVASANEMNLPDADASDRIPIGYEWPNPARYQRIASALDSRARHSLADTTALQTDSLNVLAEPLIALLHPLRAGAGDLAPAIDMLGGWDGKMETQSAAAALFETWTLRHLGRAAIGRLVPEAARPLFGSGSLASMSGLMLRPDTRLGDDPSAARDAILLESLHAAVTDLRQRLGPDITLWRWGRLHHAQPRHPLAALAEAEGSALPGFEQRELPGGYLTVRASGWRPEDYRAFVGASFRMVVDVGAWDNSLVINAPGQSGDPASPHFRDHDPLWAAGDYVPLLFSRDAIVAATETRLRLWPASSRRP